MQMLQMMMGQMQGQNPWAMQQQPYGPALNNGLGFSPSPPMCCPPYNPWGGNYGPPPSGYYQPGYGGGQVTGPQPWNAATVNRLADYASSWNGRCFKPGQTCRCADFVSTMLQQSGTAPPGFRHEEGARGVLKYGRPVDQNNLKTGDVVMFKNTYNAAHGHPITHVGIYIGDGKFVHRPTANRPVRVDSLDRGYWQEHFGAARRMNA